MKIKKAVIAFIILAFISPVFFSIMLFMQIMSAFGTEGALKSADYMSGEQTAIHRSLQEVMTPYYEDLREELAEQRIQLSIKYAEVIYPEKKPGDDSTEEDTEEEPDVIYPVVMRRINYIPENVMIAYLLMNDGINSKTAEINKWKLKSFINQISEIKESVVINAEGSKVYWLENELWTLNEITNHFFGDEDDKERFLIMCEAYGEYFDVVASTLILTDDSEVTDNSIITSMSNVPLYLQYDAAWKDVPYGNGTLKNNGCCPTCLAMVFSYFQGRNIYPTEIVAWSGSKYYVSGAGTSWSIFEPAGKQWGVPCTNIGKNETKMLDALQNGKIIIASMGPGTFTKGGHLIVLTGITASGKITVNDPNDSKIKNHIGTEFAVSLILRECKNMWVFG